MDTKIDNKELQMDSPLFPLIERVRKFALAALSKKRYEHSVRVAETAQKLCVLYGVDSSRGYLAGIGHDICKEMPDTLIYSFASRDGMPLSLIEQSKISLLHGRAAAVKLHDDFNIDDEELLQAVAAHTFGNKDFGKLGKILFIADKIEPGRENITPAILKKYFKMDLDSLTYCILKESINYVQKKDREVAPESKEFLTSLKLQIKNQKKMEK